MLTAFTRFLGYFTYLQKSFGFYGAVLFMFYYMLARLRGDRQGRLHYIPLGPYAFYFPSVLYFAGLFNEIFFKEEYYLDPTDASLRVLDCGANIGISLLYIKLRVPNARVTCFEPNPAARAVLEKNIQANSWQDSVEVFPYALGVTAGKAQFTTGTIDTDSGGRLVPNAHRNAQDSYEVSVEPLSRFIIAPIDFLKIDIEGAEFDVLEEAAAAGVLHNVSYIQLEYHDEPGVFDRPLSDMLRLLETEGFTTAVHSPIHPHLMKNGWRRNCIVYAWRVFAKIKP